MKIPRTLIQFYFYFYFYLPLSIDPFSNYIRKSDPLTTLGLQLRLATAVMIAPIQCLPSMPT